MLCWVFAAAAFTAVVSWPFPAVSAVCSHTLVRETLGWRERREGEREHLDNIIEIPAAGALIILLYSIV